MRDARARHRGGVRAVTPLVRRPVCAGPQFSDTRGCRPAGALAGRGARALRPRARLPHRPASRPSRSVQRPGRHRVRRSRRGCTSPRTAAIPDPLEGEPDRRGRKASSRCLEPTRDGDGRLRHSRTDFATGLTYPERPHGVGRRRLRRRTCRTSCTPGTPTATARPTSAGSSLTGFGRDVLGEGFHAELVPPAGCLRQPPSTSGPASAAA